jgi:flagellar basal-body rod modification protein FlgD
MDIGTAAAVQSAFDKDMFMKLLLAQMRNQDPEAPVSQAEMTSQISSMAMVEGMNNLNTSFGSVLKLQRLLSSEQMIGREVEYEQNGQKFSGLVQSIDTTSDSITLTVDGQQVPAEQITKIL